MNEKISEAKVYLQKISSIVQNEGTRDTFVIQKRLKELNEIHKSDVLIYHSENTRGKCNIYYGFQFDASLIFSFEFKLGRIPKEKTIKSILSIDEWENIFNQKIWNKEPSLKEIENDILNWVNKYKDSNKEVFNHFLQTIKVYKKYTGQLIVAYRELNGELIKIKPIIRLHNIVTLEELYEFGREKSLLLWNRVFDCKIEMVKTYWKYQLGLYSPDHITIYFSVYKNSKLSREEIYDTLLHEMVHWHLHTSGKNHGDEDFEFIEECQKIGCSLSKDNKAQIAFFEYMMLQKT